MRIQYKWLHMFWFDVLGSECANDKAIRATLQGLRAMYPMVAWRVVK